MKLTKSKLKQVIKEELNEMFGAESAEDSRSPLAKLADQMEEALEYWKTQGDEGDTERMQENFTDMIAELQEIVATQEPKLDETY